jgi:hypothetical protein
VLNLKKRKSKELNSISDYNNSKPIGASIDMSTTNISGAVNQQFLLQPPFSFFNLNSQSAVTLIQIHDNSILNQLH